MQWCLMSEQDIQVLEVNSLPCWAKLLPRPGKSELYRGGLEFKLGAVA